MSRRLEHCPSGSPLAGSSGDLASVGRTGSSGGAAAFEAHPSPFDNQVGAWPPARPSSDGRAANGWVEVAPCLAAACVPPLTRTLHRTHHTHLPTPTFPHPLGGAGGGAAPEPAAVCQPGAHVRAPRHAGHPSPPHVCVSQPQVGVCGWVGQVGAAWLFARFVRQAGLPPNHACTLPRPAHLSPHSTLAHPATPSTIQRRHIVVADERNHALGMITRRDLAHAAGSRLTRCAASGAGARLGMAVPLWVIFTKPVLPCCCPARPAAGREGPGGRGAAQSTWIRCWSGRWSGRGARSRSELRLVQLRCLIVLVSPCVILLSRTFLLSS